VLYGSYAKVIGPSSLAAAGWNHHPSLKLSNSYFTISDVPLRVLAMM